MNTVQSPLSSSSQVSSPLRRFGRRGALVLSSLLALSVLLEVFLAGGGIFTSSSWWPLHIILGLVLTLFPIVFLLLAWMGQLGRESVWLGVLTLLLIILQSFLVEIPRRIGLPILSALHPVNAVVIFGLAVFLAQRAWHGVRSDR
ncbi:MAG: hypothetical protein JOZ18_19185 [Chloroflexi bacterium]|nr:hypothetical protein [Chloroflexota bacterium]